jgi:mono/diheme cytochrome c family protein
VRGTARLGSQRGGLATAGIYPLGALLANLGLNAFPAGVRVCAAVKAMSAPRLPRWKKAGMKEAAAAALAVLLLLAALVAEAQNASGPSIWGGVFTAAQATRGNDAYQASCSGCHGSDLHATDPEAVDLTGPAIRARWNGKTLQERFETIRDTMPPVMRIR